MRELATGDYPSLADVLDEVGRKAKARGLTAETLDSLLKAHSCAACSTRTSSLVPYFYPIQNRAKLWTWRCKGEKSWSASRSCRNLRSPE